MTPTMRLRAVGGTSLLVELDSLASVLGAQSLLRMQDLPGILEIVAAARTVLVTCDSPAAVREVRALLAGPPPAHHGLPPGTRHTIKTRYDGADLIEASRLTGLSIEAMVSWHSGQRWTAAFGGFAPGFMYLTPAHHPLNVPRHASPRTIVPAGSVAVGGEFSAVYPGPSPGGWQLLGRCADVLWDPDAASPALIQPGDSVRFAPVRNLITIGEGRPPAPPHPVPLSVPQPAQPPVRGAPSTANGLLVVSAGPFTTVQDLGRPGFAHLGVTASGALDRAGLRRANRMAGNPCPAPGAAGLEIVMGGLRLQAAGSQILAVSGSGVRLSITSSGGTLRSAPANAPFLLRDGETLAIHTADKPISLRSTLAVRGGIDLPPVLGSRATDVLSGLGPEVVGAGMFLPVAPSTAIVGFPEEAPPPPPEITELRFTPGPRHDWFTHSSLAGFERRLWLASASSNRIGLRLDSGMPGDKGLERTRAAKGMELPSEGMAKGGIQVPPSGQPVLFLADHPVTGGYPVLGVVFAADLDKAAALLPGAMVRFRLVGGAGTRTSWTGWTLAT